MGLPESKGITLEYLSRITSVGTRPVKRSCRSVTNRVIHEHIAPGQHRFAVISILGHKLGTLTGRYRAVARPCRRVLDFTKFSFPVGSGGARGGQAASLHLVEVPSTVREDSPPMLSSSML